MAAATTSTQARREVHQGDALAWLRARESVPGASFVTSLPDFSEFPSLSLDEWKAWFVEAAGLVLSRCVHEGVVIFYQRDSKKDGTWVDKGYLCQKAAERTGHALLWHKVVCRAPAGQITFGRPAYSHLLCLSKGVRLPLEVATPDVIPSAGKVTWTRGMGVAACRAAVSFVRDRTGTRTIVDPFCGHGSVLAVANALGLDAVGVELGRKRAERARELSYVNGAEEFR